MTTEPPSEWPPSTTLPPSFLAAPITACRSWTATFMPHCLANSTVEFGIDLEVVGDARVLEVAEVVVEELGRRGLALLEQVQLRLVLEQVLAPLDRPHLPARGLGHDPLGQGHEVGAAGRGAGLEDQDVLGVARPDLEDTRPCCTGPAFPATSKPCIHSTRRGADETTAEAEDGEGPIADANVVRQAMTVPASSDRLTPADTLPISCSLVARSRRSDDVSSPGRPCLAGDGGHRAATRTIHDGLIKIITSSNLAPWSGSSSVRLLAARAPARVSSFSTRPSSASVAMAIGARRWPRSLGTWV